MEFRKVFSWVSDDMPETTTAVVVASACGVIKVLSFNNWNKANKSYSTIKERVCKTFTNRGKQRSEPDRGQGKYLSCMINGKHRQVHRMVALAWIPNPEGKPQVNHKNGIRDDNRVENLEWVTNTENADHAKKTGLTKDRNQRRALPESLIPEIKELRMLGYSINELGEKYGVTGECIRDRTNQIMTDDERVRSLSAAYKRRSEKRKAGVNYV